MTGLLLRKVLSGLLLVFVVASATFFLLNLTGQDPARQIAGQVPSEDQVDVLRAELGLDQPLLVRYIAWLTGAVRGDLGVSWYTKQPVVDLVGYALPATLSLVLGAVLLTAVLGAGVGVLSAIRQGGVVDRALQVFSTITQSIPNLLIAIGLVLVFAVTLSWLPATGFIPFASSPVGWITSITLPVIALALGGIASVGLQVRGSMIDVLQLDYIRTLKSRGIPRRSILFQHALRNAAPPALTTLSLMFIVLISGAIIVEKVFNIPGIGTLANISASQGDLPLVLGVVVITVVMVVIVNLLMELAQGWLNPKVRAS